jgi:hypothetical protein
MMMHEPANVKKSLKYFDKIRSLFHFGNFVLIIWQANHINVEQNFIVVVPAAGYFP